MCCFVVNFPLFPYVPEFVGVKNRGIEEKCRLVVLRKNNIITGKRCVPLCKHLERFCKGVFLLSFEKHIAFGRRKTIV